MNIRRKFLAACVAGVAIVGSSTNADAQITQRMHGLALIDGASGHALTLSAPALSAPVALSFPTFSGGANFVLTTSTSGQSIANGLTFSGTPLTGSNALVYVNGSVSGLDGTTYYGTRSNLSVGTSGVNTHAVAVEGIATGTDDIAIGGRFAATGTGTNIGVDVTAGGMRVEGGINNTGDGLTNTGAIAGATTLNASGTVTFGALNAGGLVKATAATGDLAIATGADLPSGSTNYIQNQNAGAQASANFNIDGSGTVGGTLSAANVNSTNGYQIGGNNVFNLVASTSTRVGYNTGLAMSGQFNTLLGYQAGRDMTTGVANTILGQNAGHYIAAQSNNTLVGRDAGHQSSGSSNTMLGTGSGYNTAGSDNAYVGINAGFDITTGAQNTFLGAEADGLATGSNQIAIGYNAIATASNQVMLGNTAVTSVQTYGSLSDPGSALQVADDLDVTGALTLGTALATAEGGTGITAAPTAAGEFLRSSGAGTWAIGTIQSGDIEASDVPDLGATYVKTDGTSATYAGQASITTLGTITTGTWNGTSIADANVDNNLTISGGTINNTPIGATTRSTGAFTTIDVDPDVTNGLEATVNHVRVTGRDVNGSELPFIVQGDGTALTYGGAVGQTRGRLMRLDLNGVFHDFAIDGSGNLYINDNDATQITFPAATGTVALTSDIAGATVGGDLTGTVSNAQIAAGAIENADISGTAAIDFSKLATLATGSIIAGNAGVATAVAMSGDATIGNTGVVTIADDAVQLDDIQNITDARLLGNNSGGAASPSEISLGAGLVFSGASVVVDDAVIATDVQVATAVDNAIGGTTGQIATIAGASSIGSGDLSGDITTSGGLVTAIAAGAIVDADVNAAAAIAGSKINPNFGSQNVTTSGNISTTGTGDIITGDRLQFAGAAATIDIVDASTLTIRDGGNTLMSIADGGAVGNVTITGDLTVNGTINGTVSNATTAVNFSGNLAGDVTGTQGATVVANVGGVTAANVASGANLANAATDANTASTIVRRDASGNFTAGTITADLTGTATNATTAVNFSGNLAGDVTGTQGATVVANVGGVTAANVASGANAANAATSANTASTIVARDASGNFSAGTITANLSGTATNATNATTAVNFSGNLAGDVTGTQGATVVASVGGESAATIGNAIGFRTSTNSPSTLVERNGAGGFSAGDVGVTNLASTGDVETVTLSGAGPNRLADRVTLDAADFSGGVATISNTSIEAGAVVIISVSRVNLDLDNDTVIDSRSFQPIAVENVVANSFDVVIDLAAEPTNAADFVEVNYMVINP